MAATPPPDATGWVVNEAVAPLTGAATVSATLTSVNPILNMVGLADRARLVLRCSDQQIIAYVAWPQVLTISGSAFMNPAQTQAMVLWRLDDAPIIVNFWDRSDSGTAAGKFATKGAQKLIAQIVSAKRMVIRMTGQTQQDAVFDLAGVGPAAAKVEQACGLTPSVIGARP